MRLDAAAVSSRSCVTKERALFPFPLFPMTWTQKHFTLWRLARLLLPCFCLAISPVAADAQLTQQQVYSAVFNALYDWTTMQPYNPDVVNTFPVDFNNASLAEYLGPGGDATTPYLLSILQLLQTLSTSSSSNQLQHVLDYLDSINLSADNLDDIYLTAEMIRTCVEPLLQYTFVPDSNGDSALLVYDSELYSKAVDQENDLESIDSHIVDLRVAIESLHLGDVGGYVSNIVDVLDPPTDEYLPDSEIDLPDDDDQLSEVLIVPPSTTWTHVDYSDLSYSAGSPEIVLWENVKLAGFDIPDGKIDLTQPQIARGVSVMGRISRTLWWLAYYTGLFLLLRREYVYYTSLGSSEGAA